MTSAESARARALKGTHAERAVRFVMLGVMALGIGLRARGFLFSTMALWQDEG